jgi:hypothetical protein
MADRRACRRFALSDVDAVVEPDTARDPGTWLRWTTSTRQPATGRPIRPVSDAVLVQVPVMRQTLIGLTTSSGASVVVDHRRRSRFGPTAALRAQ